MHGHDFYQPFDQLPNAQVFFYKICYIFLSKCQFDDLVGEHFKIVPFTIELLLCLMKIGVPFTIELLLCLMKIGGFNIIMPHGVII
jgi:hypothetical protein